MTTYANATIASNGNNVFVTFPNYGWIAYNLESTLVMATAGHIITTLCGKESVLISYMSANGATLHYKIRTDNLKQLS